ncbi:MAG: hypothetical protein KIT43_07275 [Bauldia sp.]|nr:hypothetical protein [Bauldia sp.]MCW5718350.1 hypothetical protein [Bauldia sp.]
MPAESIVALVAIMGMFVFFSAVLGWASRNAPATFPEASPVQREPARPTHGHSATAGAH